MDRDKFQEKIKDAIEAHVGSLDADHIAELAIDSIWDEIENYITNPDEFLFDES